MFDWRAGRNRRQERQMRRMQVITPAVEPALVDVVDEPMPVTAVDTDKQSASEDVSFREYFDSPKEIRRRRNGKLERWDNAKAGYIGYLTGKGHTSQEIADIVRDGTSRDTIRGVWRRWGLPMPQMNGQRCSILPVALPMGIRWQLAARAIAQGLSPNEFLRRVITCVVEDDLYRAVVDDRFDPKPKRGRGRPKVIRVEPDTQGQPPAAAAPVRSR